MKVDVKLEKKVKDFNDMNLKEELLRGIYGRGFESPLKIQQSILPIISSNRGKNKNYSQIDFIVQCKLYFI
jgi:superfamily II DNA/RNA helicase